MPSTKIKSPPTLKKTGRAHDRDRLIHDPLADTEVVIDPSLDFFALGDLITFETGADNDPYTQPHQVCVRNQPS